MKIHITAHWSSHLKPQIINLWIGLAIYSFSMREKNVFQVDNISIMRIYVIQKWHS